MTEFSKLRITQDAGGDPPPGSGAVRLEDFLDPAAPPPPPLRQLFESHVSIIMRVRGLPRAEAERAAYENTVVDHLNATFSGTDPSRCAHCGRSGETPLPIGAGERHVWLHRNCWELWRAAAGKGDRRAG
jgi:hypothetical protein